MGSVRALWTCLWWFVGDEGTCYKDWQKNLHGTTLGTELIIHYTGLGRGLYRITR